MFDLSNLLTPPAVGSLPAYSEFEVSHQVMLIGLAAFSAIWITALGAAVGSFLNVVVYRLPLGMSLVRPKSRCPACGASIRASDNVPVLGWLRLKGRCRNCRNPISARYPLVEATTAALFLGLAHFELFSGGANLPGTSDVTHNLNSILWHIRPELITLYLYHVILACSLLCLSLIVWDGFAPPKSLVITTLLLGFFFPFFFPSAHPISSGVTLPLPSYVLFQNDQLSAALSPAALLDSVLGTGVGLLFGLTAAISVNASADRWGVIAAITMIGTFLGWQAVVSCALITAALSIGRPFAAFFLPLPLTSLVAASLLIQIPFWKTLDRLNWWAGSQGWPLLRTVGWPETGFVWTTLLVAGIAAVLFLFATSWLTGLVLRFSRQHDLMIARETELTPISQSPESEGITAGDADR